MVDCDFCHKAIEEEVRCFICFKVFCSEACLEAHEKADHEKVCENCGKKFLGRHYTHIKKDGIFCSSDCMESFHGENPEI